MDQHIQNLCRALRREECDGWLFYGFQHRDPITRTLLRLSAGQVNSRRFFYILFPDPEKSVQICHHVEAYKLNHLPGTVYRYASFTELQGLLKSFSGLRLAAQFSVELPIFSFLDYGTAQLLNLAGIELVSSKSLIQSTMGIIDSEGIASHRRAAEALYEIVDLCTNRLTGIFKENKQITEGAVRDGVVDFIAKEVPQRGVHGSEPDRLCRGIITAAGFSGGIKHRTGHGIDAEAHGSGVNLDSTEFPDSRVLIEGSCFSIEPGVYLDDFGMRSEINAYIHNNSIEVSGGPVQQNIVTLL